MPTDGLPAFEAFNSLTLNDMTVWESRAAGLLIYGALYGARWASASHDTLRSAVAELRAKQTPYVTAAAKMRAVPLIKSIP